MAEPQPRDPHFLPNVPANPPHTAGVPGFPDTFFGPNDKNYVDRKVKDMLRLRGVDMYFYRMRDQTKRIDGEKPLSDSPDSIPEVTPRRRSGNMSLYGEPVIVKKRIDATKREVIPDWNYDEPVLVRGLIVSAEEEATQDERGFLSFRKATVHFGRAVMEELDIEPREGDVVRLPSLLDSFYDVKWVNSDAHRFGATGFFSIYEAELIRNPLFSPERKLQGGT